MFHHNNVGILLEEEIQFKFLEGKESPFWRRRKLNGVLRERLFD